jgi:hypothetical protein
MKKFVLSLVYSARAPLYVTGSRSCVYCVGDLVLRFLVLELCSSRVQLDLLLSHQISQLELVLVYSLSCGGFSNTSARCSMKCM